MNSERPRRHQDYTPADILPIPGTPDRSKNRRITEARLHPTTEENATEFESKAAPIRATARRSINNAFTALKQLVHLA